MFITENGEIVKDPVCPDCGADVWKKFPGIDPAEWGCEVCGWKGYQPNDYSKLSRYGISGYWTPWHLAQKKGAAKLPRYGISGYWTPWHLVKK